MRLAMLVMVASCSRSATQPTPAPKDGGERMLTIDQIEDEIWGAGPKATFVATTPAEVDVIQQLVPQLFEATADANIDAWRTRAATAGFKLEKWRVGDDHYLALLEKQVHGAGAYVFRVAPRADGPTILLEAPHNYFDVGTGPIAVKLFFTPRDGARPRALFTNTIHRYQLAPGDKKKRAHNPADIAHEPEHAFSIATVAFARAAGDTQVIQLHGFAPKADDDGDGEVGDIAAVVSAGNREGSSALSAGIAKSMTSIFGDGVKRYPEDVQVLGATTNAQGRLLRDVRGASFVHVEMSAAVRDKLRADGTVRAQLAAALFDARSTP